MSSGKTVTLAPVSSWSSGQVEGQDTKVKLVKRQGYGRANFDLLRKTHHPHELTTSQDQRQTLTPCPDTWLTTQSNTDHEAANAA
jgi:hypothetical protein